MNLNALAAVHRHDFRPGPAGPGRAFVPNIGPDSGPRLGAESPAAAAPAALPLSASATISPQRRPGDLFGMLKAAVRTALRLQSQSGGPQRAVRVRRVRVPDDGHPEPVCLTAPQGRPGIAAAPRPAFAAARRRNCRGETIAAARSRCCSG